MQLIIVSNLNTVPSTFYIPACFRSIAGVSEFLKNHQCSLTLYIITPYFFLDIDSPSTLHYISNVSENITNPDKFDLSVSIEHPEAVPDINKLGFMQYHSEKFL